tara:strand:+ start:724085 stop:724192 length:108 start_codon:yes stop_codon:yes gene_type:complete
MNALQQEVKHEKVSRYYRRLAGWHSHDAERDTRDG